MPELEAGSESKRKRHKRERVYEAARALASTNPPPSWATFFRRILGPKGVVRRTYRTARELAEFERSETYADILQMLTRLRERATPESLHEPTRVVTIRVPASMHDALRQEAFDHQTSMNKLCISKLLKFIEAELVPRERWKYVSAPGVDGEPTRNQQIGPADRNASASGDKKEAEADL